MADSARQMSLLLVSSGTSLRERIDFLLTPDRFGKIVSVSGADEARRAFSEFVYDAAVIDSPLSDDPAQALALDLIRYETTGVLLFTSGEYGVSDYAEYGILTVIKPCDRQMLRQAFLLLSALHSRLGSLAEKAETLQSRMDEIKLVNRAKLLLMQKMKMSESEAHRYIEKRAMDRCLKRREVAENIISYYEKQV